MSDSIENTETVIKNNIYDDNDHLNMIVSRVSNANSRENNINNNTNTNFYNGNYKIILLIH